MTDDRRVLDWQRFVGVCANVSQGNPDNHPMIGVAPDVCPCCDESYIVIAAVAPNGAEVNVSLPPEVALDVAQRIVDSYQQIGRAPAGRTQ